MLFQILRRIGLLAVLLLLMEMHSGCGFTGSGTAATGFFNNTSGSGTPGGYPIVDTGQASCFDNSNEITPPQKGQPFYGQDAQHSGNQPSYTDNGDGTVTDNVTGLMWQKGFCRVLRQDARELAAAADTGGYTDWRVPSVKELYSLVDFTGSQGTATPSSQAPPPDAKPFINTGYFDFQYPDTGPYIDARYVSRTAYTARVMGKQPAFFGVNFADGSINAYPRKDRRSHPVFYARFVRGNPDYGKNAFADNGDGTVTDTATGLMWTRIDSGNPDLAKFADHDTNGALNWEQALMLAQKADLAGYTDWRLPNAKELQSILDYTRAPGATHSPAIHPLFETTPILNEADREDYPVYWTATSSRPRGRDAVTIAFGQALGFISPWPGMEKQFCDVHGAGGQLSDAKAGLLTYGSGPLGDVRRGINHVRLVRDVSPAG